MKEMAKSKHQYGSFVVAKTGYRKYARFFVTALIVVIFVLGGGILVYKKLKPVKKEAIVQQATGPIPGWWYQKYFSTNVCEKDICEPDADPDGDDLTNQQEFYYHTNPLVAFTVKDTLNDGQLVAAGFDPSRPGRMTFDQVTAPDNILGESLLVAQDLKDIVAENNDPSKVPLPLVTDDQLKITQNQNQDTYNTYGQQLNDAINKFFTQNDLSNIEQLLKSGTEAQVENFKTKSGLLAADLQGISVPQKFLMYHKYLLTFFQLIPKVLLSKGDPVLGSASSSSDVWYQNAQALMVITQKLNAEKERLGMSAQITP